MQAFSCHVISIKIIPFEDCFFSGRSFLDSIRVFSSATQVEILQLTPNIEI